MWWVFAILSAVFAALTGLFAKMGVKDVDTNVANAVRTLVVVFLAWGIVAVRGSFSEVMALTKQNVLFLILSGTGTALSWFFYFIALQKGDLSRVAPVDKAGVPIAIILAVIFLNETLTWKTIAGSILIIAGTVLVIL
jgi:transporter family protein